MGFRSPEAAATVSNTAPKKLQGGSEPEDSHCTYQRDAGPSLVVGPISRACVHSCPGWDKAPVPPFGTT